MIKNVNFNVEKKFKKVFKNIPKDVPLIYEMGTILNLMQEMYELGFVDGHAKWITDIKNRINNR